MRAGVILAPGRRIITAAPRILARDRDHNLRTLHRLRNRAPWSSGGSGSSTVCRPLPQTRSGPSSHETSSRRMVETALARRPRRARRSKIALSRMPCGFVRSHEAMSRSTSLERIYRGSVDTRHCAMEGARRRSLGDRRLVRRATSNNLASGRDRLELRTGAALRHCGDCAPNALSVV